MDRRTNNINTPADMTNENIDGRTDKFATVINFEKSRKKNFPLKIDFKIKCNFKTEMKNFPDLQRKLETKLL